MNVPERQPPGAYIERLVKDFTSQLDGQPEARITSTGFALDIEGGAVVTRGLSGAGIGNLVTTEHGETGFIAKLQKDAIGQKAYIVMIDPSQRITPGTPVETEFRPLSVPVGDALIGRVVNALGQPLDGHGPINYDKRRPIERIAPPVIERQDVDTPLFTGIKAIDAMIPIGRGQRELIIGDRQIGKTQLALDIIINQKDTGVLCVYVAIGKRKSEAAQIVRTLKDHDALAHTTVILASADDPAAMQYAAPFSGCAMGEEFMEQGRDVLVVYDDLTKHAWAWRQISSQLNRPPGRQAYPGDIFYLHSRLLERSARLSDAYRVVPIDPQSPPVTDVHTGTFAKQHAEAKLKNLPNPEFYRLEKVPGSGGSLTALPIIETLQGDVSAYIPTNVISITDGQIYLESELFLRGMRPAINVGLSVSRVGGDAQRPIMKQVAPGLRTDMSAYRDLALLTAVESNPDPATKRRLVQGQHLEEVLKQDELSHRSLSQEIVVLFACLQNLVSDVSIPKMRDWEKGLLTDMATNQQALLNKLATGEKMSQDTKQELTTVISQFTRRFLEDGNVPTPAVTLPQITRPKGATVKQSDAKGKNASVFEETKDIGRQLVTSVDELERLGLLSPEKVAARKKRREEIEALDKEMKKFSSLFNK